MMTCQCLLGHNNWCIYACKLFVSVTKLITLSCVTKLTISSVCIFYFGSGHSYLAIVFCTVYVVQKDKQRFMYIKHVELSLTL